MNNLTITLVQQDIYWEQTEANLAAFEESLANGESPADVYILPEMFNTGFTMNVSLAEVMNSKTNRWMKQMAAQHQALFIGSLPVQGSGKVFNRLLVVKPEGETVYYDKKHLFSMSDEAKYYNPGNTRLTVEYKGWKICPLVCYDLRFPVWSRNNPKDPYDLLLYVANWPQPRIKAWETLLQARAIENACYVAGVNRTGTDGQQLYYPGNSLIVDPKGNIVQRTGDQPMLAREELNAESLQRFRDKFPVLADADPYKLI